jgi:uncharacterized protein (TIGR02466 family)
MQTKFLMLFPTTIAITENFLTSDELEILLQKVKDVNDMNEHDLIYGDSQSSHSKDLLNGILDRVKDTSLYTKIVDKLNEYTSSMGLYDVSIRNSWVNIQRPDSFLNAHNHNNSKISAALYLKVDDKSSNIIFHDAHPFRNFREFNSQNAKENKLNLTEYSLKPTAGMLVLFPSWLNHSGDTNHSDERIAISFNADSK